MKYINFVFIDKVQILPTSSAKNENMNNIICKINKQAKNATPNRLPFKNLTSTGDGGLINHGAR